jgi:hypothetical protein
VFVGKERLRRCRSKRHFLMNDYNVIVSKDGKRRCLDCWWERKLGFIEEFNRSKATGATTASASELLEWSEKAEQVVKIAEEAVRATRRLAQQQDLRLFKAVRKVQQAQKRHKEILQIAHEISEAWKLKANHWPELKMELSSLPVPKAPIPESRSTNDMLAELLELVRTRRTSFTRLDYDSILSEDLGNFLQEDLRNFLQDMHGREGTKEISREDLNEALKLWRNKRLKEESRRIETYTLELLKAVEAAQAEKETKQ